MIESLVLDGILPDDYFALLFIGTNPLLCRAITSRKWGNGAPPLVPVVQKPVLKGALAPVVYLCQPCPSLQPFSTAVLTMVPVVNTHWY